MTFDGGNRLLYAVSAKREMQWPAFKSAADAVLPLAADTVLDMRRARSLAAAMGDSLGHWDLLAQDGASARICVAPPSLARLPWTGLPRAVLCGSRSPDTLDAVTAAAAVGGIAVRQRRVHPYAPARIEITAKTDSDAKGFANELGVHYDQEPAAWLLASLSCSARDYFGTLEWSPESELDWPCREFDSDRLAFRTFSGPSSGRRDSSQPRLLSYEHPAGWTRRDRLIVSGKIAVVDRSWGRYLVLAAAGKQVLQTDKRRGTVKVPRQVPLPKLLARALSLCNGEPPHVAHGPGIGEHIYSGVPATIIDAVVGKLTLDGVAADRLSGGTVQ